MSEIVSYKCPACGAPLEFDIQNQNWNCKFCLSEYTLSDLEKTDAAEPPEQPIESSRDPYNDEAMAYTCPSCGGRIVTDKNTAATFCVYCHNPAVIASRLADEFRPVKILPFQIEKPQVLKAMTKLMSKRPLLPKAFRDIVQKGEIGGLYVPFWLFSADMDSFLAAHGQRIMIWSDTRFRYTKTDTYHVERAASFAFRDLPADGTERFDNRLTQALEPFDYKQMQDFSMGYLSGHYAESYDIEAPTAAVTAFSRMNDGANSMMRSLVTGYNSFQVIAQRSSKKRTENTYVMLPMWTLAADYKGKRYTFAMNGQTGKMVGKLPISIGRAAAWFAGVTAVAAAIAFAVGVFI